MVDLTTTDIIARLALATLLSSLVGMEREWREKPAGIRTNVMVGLGACLFTMASAQTPGLWPDVRPIDPGRIAAQIVSGIGFIGAGAIIFRSREGAVFGLTTAATLWVVAGLGLAVGYGFYLEAIIATAMVFFTFFVLGRLVNMIRVKRGSRRYVRQLMDENHPEMSGMNAGDDE